mmetsp:Transcript_78131/g.253540  ORF Transcript_78131/g.253540 Transcript_78131/m.253540 type:complete len:228 (+) Transcript_78131:5690-6373(+)
MVAHLRERQEAAHCCQDASTTTRARRSGPAAHRGRHRCPAGRRRAAPPSPGSRSRSPRSSRRAASRMPRRRRRRAWGGAPARQFLGLPPAQVQAPLASRAPDPAAATALGTAPGRLRNRPLHRQQARCSRRAPRGGRSSRPDPLISPVPCECRAHCGISPSGRGVVCCTAGCACRLTCCSLCVCMPRCFLSAPTARAPPPRHAAHPNPARRSAGPPAPADSRGGPRC